MMRDNTFDVIVIGAGIAGASVAARLAVGTPANRADGVRILLLEMEGEPGYHTTGRSAALFSETYGPPVIRALTRASAAFFDRPPDGFSDNPLLSARGAMLIARPDQIPALDNLIAESEKLTPVRRLTVAQAHGLAPLLRPDYLAGAMLEPGARDIDVNSLHQGFLKMFRVAGGVLQTNSAVTEMSASANGWEVRTSKSTYRAPVVVNAAGAWADQIGMLAGAKPIGLMPRRRTALIVKPPDQPPGHQPVLSDWPAVIDVGERFYMKPEAGNLLISPADETPSAPCDAQPEELDIAVCVDRIETAFDIQIKRIKNQWAGLRSFVADKGPVCGFDNDRAGFFWLAGQGGYGIQSSPALSRVAAALVNQTALPQDILDQGLDPADLSVTRQVRA